MEAVCCLAVNENVLLLHSPTPLSKLKCSVWGQLLTDKEGTAWISV